MLDATLNYVALMAEPCSCETKFCAKVSAVLAHDILQFHMLEISPDPFVRIEIGRIARQPLQMDAFGPACRQKLLEHLSLVNGGAIPQNQHLARNVPQHVLDKSHDVCSTIGRFLHLHQHL